MNYLFGWNPVAEFIVEELIAQGVHIDGIVIDDDYFADRPKHIGREVYSFGKMEFGPSDTVINCLGYRNLHRRIMVGDLLSSAGVLKSFVSSEAKLYPGCMVGLGAVLLGNVIVERNSVIGEHSLLWGGARVCHDSQIGRGVFMASGAIVGGQCKVGDTCTIGFNSSVKENSHLRMGTHVGANRFQTGNVDL
jgi:predicted acyltransferase (DUF342 family)